ncbi:unnamed protein product, partial [Laminaria digitata]
CQRLSRRVLSCTTSSSCTKEKASTRPLLTTTKQGGVGVLARRNWQQRQKGLGLGSVRTSQTNPCWRHGELRVQHSTGLDRPQSGATVGALKKNVRRDSRFFDPPRYSSPVVHCVRVQVRKNFTR